MNYFLKCLSKITFFAVFVFNKNSVCANKIQTIKLSTVSYSLTKRAEYAVSAVEISKR